MTELTTTLGRKLKAPSGTHYAVTEDTKVSRNHASIVWDAAAGAWVLGVNHKAGLDVDLKHYGKGEKVTLTGRAAIRIIDAKLYFLPPAAAAAAAAK